MAVRHLAAFLALALALFAATAAAAQAPAPGKEGVWAIDAANGSCAASLTLPDGAIFLLRGTNGEINVALFAHSKLPQGKTARLETEAYGFDFKPGFSKTRDALYTAEYASARMVAGLRLAREVRLLVGGRLAAVVTLEDTGFERALDGVIACSKGDTGWWGRGVDVAYGSAQPKAGPPKDVASKEVARPTTPAGPAARGVVNKEGLWEIVTSEDPGVCTAQAVVEEHVYLQFPATAGQVGLAVGADRDLARGRKGRLETDDFTLAFSPSYASRRLVAAEDPFDGEALSALKRAKWIRITVDGRPLADATVEGTGFPGVLDAVAACSKSRKGWWGKGAAKAPPVSADAR